MKLDKVKDTIEKKTEELSGKTVKEIADLSKKHMFILLVSLMALLAFSFSFVLYGQSLDMLAILVGTITGLYKADMVSDLCTKSAAFFVKQEGTIVYVLAGAAVAGSIFLHPLFFLAIGLFAGKSLYFLAKNR